MPVDLRCPCGKPIRVRDELRGRRVRCPHCGGITAVPAPVEELVPLTLAEDEPADDVVAMQLVEEEDVPTAQLAGGTDGPPVGNLRLWWHYARDSLAFHLLFFVASPPAAYLIFVVAEDQSSAIRERYARDGVPAQATVIHKAGIQVGPVRIVKKDMASVTYRYTTADGQTFEREMPVPIEKWRQMNEGDVLAIQYLRSEPSESSVARDPREDWNPDTIKTVLLVIGIPMSSLATFGLLLSLWRTRRRIDLLRHGTRAIATVTRARLPEGVIAYSYRDHGGRKHDGRTPRPKRKDYAEGDRLVVSYDPQRPGRHEVDRFGVRVRV